jgi:hypothetical protein
MNKQILLEFIDFLRFKIENDLLTMEDVESIKYFFESSVIIRGTAEDFAKFYCKSQYDVRNVIHRRMIEKPIRRVYYSFGEFRKIVPTSWKKVPEKKDYAKGKNVK